MAQAPVAKSAIVRAYLGLGGNVGDVVATLRAACAAIGRLPSTRVERVASLYKTSPVGFLEQPDFINTVVSIDTGLTANALVEAVKGIERGLGRIERPRWHEREIDIDVLTYDDVIVALEDIRIPHPRLHERLFVLVPFAEIAPNVVPTGGTATVSELLHACNDTGTVVHAGSLTTSI